MQQAQRVAQYVNAAHEANLRGDFTTAARVCKQALQLAPDLPEAWYNLGIAEGGLGNTQESVRALGRARDRTLDSPDAQNAIGLALLEVGALPEAERCFTRVLDIAPDFVFAHSNLGKLRETQHRIADAEACFRRAIALQPNFAPLYANLGGILSAQKQFVEAEIACRKAVELDPRLPDAWNNLAHALLSMKCYEAAEGACRKAIELIPQSVDAWITLAGALSSMARYEPAEAACRQAIMLAPKSPEAWANLGGALVGLKRHEAAEAACRQAIALNHTLREAWNNLGGALFGLKRHEEAAECFRRSLELNPDAEFLLGDLMHAQMQACDWRHLDRELPELLQRIARGEKVTSPFPLLALTADPAMQRMAAEIFAAERYPEQRELGPIPKRPRREKIRIGYYSADFHNHATSYLIAELFELHDKGRFELIAFSFGPDRQDEMRKRVSAAFDRFIDVRGQTSKAVAQHSRELEIDIAVDLKGYTEDCQTEIFAYRAAPIQVSYLGYPGTMGAPYIDYLIADKSLIPVGHQRHYSEKIVYLPHSYQINDAKRQIADKTYSRDALGLPPTGFVFCCFNNNYKITPQTFDAWMRILQRAEGSVLWLFEASPAAAANLRSEASARGVDPDRLIFAKRLPLAEHLARIRTADLFLDTLPYNAHTTTSDALWAGVPVLTLPGEAFASRVAASLLNAIGLPELVVDSQAAYEALAVDLAINPAALRSVRDKLKENRLTAPLFDSPKFVRHIEQAYSELYLRYQQGLSPSHLEIGV